jgi:hypothetical protein
MKTNCCTSDLLFLFVFAVLLIPTALDQVMAEEKYIPAGADGRFDLWYKPRTSVNGATPSEAQRISAKAERIAQHLRGIPAVNTPPPPLCARVYYLVEQGVGGNNDNKMIAGSLGVTLPEFFDKKKQRGSSLTATGIAMRFNDRTPVPLIEAKGPNQSETLEDEYGKALYFLSRVVEKSGRVTRFKNGTVLITRDAVSIVLPVSKERYLRMLERQWLARIAAEQKSLQEASSHEPYTTWLNERPKRIAAYKQALKDNEALMKPAELENLRRSFEKAEQENEALLKRLHNEMPQQNRQMEAAVKDLELRLEKVRKELRTLSPTQLQAPACLSDDFSKSALNNETAGPMDSDEMKWIYSYNPQYFGRSGSKANIEMLTLSCSQRKEMIESEERFAFRMKMYRAIDWNKLAQFVD